MCYKDEVQMMNEQKLRERFERDNVPQFIQKYILKTRSSNSMAACLNNWIVIKDMLLWMLENKIINKDAISDIKPEDFKFIEAQDLSNYLQYKEDNGMSPTTLETRKFIFSGFWKRMADSEICPVEKNIVKTVDYRGIPSANNIIKKLPTEQQLEKMMEKIMLKKDEFVRDRNACVLRVLIGTGIRESELAGLDLEDLFLDGDENNDMPYIMVLGKKSYRKEEMRRVYLTGDACASIKEFLSLRNAMENVVDQSAVFINKNGKRLTEDNIKSMFKNYGGGITPHMIRHYFATIMSSTGNIVFVQQQLGHKSQTTTVNSYANGAYGMKEVLANM